jgi:hypothetical protein
MHLFRMLEKKGELRGGRRHERRSLDLSPKSRLAVLATTNPSSQEEHQI